MRHLIVLCGPSGCGKTVIGKWLAQDRGYQFVDGDESYTQANKLTLITSTTLTDTEYEQWLDKVATRALSKVDQHRVVILACSSLKQSYRDRLRSNVANSPRGRKDKISIRFVYLSMDEQKAKHLVQCLKPRYDPLHSGIQVSAQYELWEQPLLRDEPCFALNCNADLFYVRKAAVKLVKDIVRRRGLTGRMKDCFYAAWLSWNGGGMELGRAYE